MSEVEVRIIAWFTADFRSSKADGKEFMSAYCRVCGREVTRHEVLGLDATPEQIVVAHDDEKTDSEMFFAHLYSAHQDRFEDGDTGPLNT